jgi:hypothetical protein
MRLSLPILLAATVEVIALLQLTPLVDVDM